MALPSFKISRGLSTRLPQTLVDGQMYFCTDTNIIYIDYKNENGELMRSSIGAGTAESITIYSNGQPVKVDCSKIVTSDNVEDLIGDATTSKSGLMSPDDKTRLNNMATITVKTWTTADMGGAS